MPSFEPFAAVRYTGAAGEPDRLIAPPYDVISPDERAELAARSPRNAVLLELPDSHDEAARLWREWLGDGTLARDPAPALYAYRMSFRDESGAERATTGVLGSLGLEEPGRGILPHEHTTAKDKADRLGLLRAVRANLSPIWVLTPAPGLARLCDAGGAAPDVRAVDDDGVVHELWVVDDPDRQRAIAEAVSAEPVLVADGHHRFEVGNAYRAEDGAAPGAGRILAYAVELADDQLVVQPIHRLLDGPVDGLLDHLAGWFDVVAAPDGPPDPTQAGGPVLVTRSGAHVLRPTRRADEAAGDGLDTSRLRAALEGAGVEVRYQHGTANARAAVERGEADAAVLVRPATVAQIAATGRGGNRMPPKTTFFWPKPRTGVVFRSLDEPA